MVKIPRNIDDGAELRAPGVKAGEQFLEAQASPPLSLMQRYLRLKNAVVKIYTAAHWSPDRALPFDPQRLWTELRDAAEIVPGNSPKPAPKRGICAALSVEQRHEKAGFHVVGRFADGRGFILQPVGEVTAREAKEICDAILSLAVAAIRREVCCGTINGDCPPEICPRGPA